MKWNLSSGSLDVARRVSNDTWATLAQEATVGDRRLGLRTNFQLVLRHASGQMFQEAHYHAVFDSPGQMLLAGFSPAPVRPLPFSSHKGLHFTPPSLARSVVEEALSARMSMESSTQALITVFDPACGSGEFLREALRLLNLNGHRGPVKLIGWDISPAACSTSRFVLSWEARSFPNKVEIEISARNSLEAAPWPDDVDLLLMNPPFVSWEDMDSHEREVVVETLGKSGKNRPDMASAFLWRATLSLKSLAVLGVVMPASILSSKTAASLRSYLSDLISVRLVARLGSQQLFSNAIVDPAFIVCLRGKDINAGEIALWADHRPESTSASLRALRRARHAGIDSDTLVSADGYSIYRQPGLARSAENWVPRKYAAWRLFRATEHLPRVNDFFDVHQGIRTGANNVFIISPERWEGLPARERRYFRPAVVNSSIMHNFLSISMYVFYPYGKLRLDGETDLVRQLPSYFESVLLPAKEQLLRRARVQSERWWELTLHRGWQVVEEPKLVSTYFGDNESFAVDKIGHSVVVQGYGWFPKGKPLQARNLPSNFSLACLALLSSKLTANLLSAVSSHVGGGQWDLSTRFVNRLPMPNLLSHDFAPEIYSGLVEEGERLSEGAGLGRKTLEELAVAAYGLGEL